MSPDRFLVWIALAWIPASLEAAFCQKVCPERGYGRRALGSLHRHIPNFTLWCWWHPTLLSDFLFIKNSSAGHRAYQCNYAMLASPHGRPTARTCWTHLTGRPVLARSYPFSGVSCGRQQNGGFSTQPTDAATLAKLLRVDYACIWNAGFVLLVAQLFTFCAFAGTDNNGCLPTAAWAFC